MTIGERIKERRKELGMTQQELAEKIGYSGKTAISKIEMNERDLRQSKIRPIAEALETTVDYIMGWTDGTEDALIELAKEKTDDDMLLDLFHQLNDDGKAQAMMQLKVLTMMDDFRENKSG